MGKRGNRNRTNINSLPVELIDLIVIQVDKLVQEDRDPRHALAEAAGLGLDGGGGIEAGLMALFGGLLQGGLQPPRAPVRAPTPPPIPPTPEEINGELPLHDVRESGSESESDSNDDSEEEEDSDVYDSDGELVVTDGTYPDGLPADPLVPLSLISRPFLTVARQKLYRKSVTHPTSLSIFSLTSPRRQIRYHLTLSSIPPLTITRRTLRRRRNRRRTQSSRLARSLHPILADERDEPRTRRSECSHRYPETLHRSRGSSLGALLPSVDWVRTPRSSQRQCRY